MHPVQKTRILGLVALFAILTPLYLVLPLSEGPFLASPDETSNAEVIRQIAWYGRVSTPESLAVEFPWLHPRSFVSHGTSIVPVGFLGWPWILSLFSLILGLAIAPVLASLVAVSMAYPLFNLLEEKFGTRSAWLGTLVGMSVPGMIVFGNRALFPQVPVLALGFWIVWLWSKFKSETRWWPYAISGVLAALAFATRPTEMFWLVPWLMWAGWNLRPTRKQLIATCVSFLIPLVILGVFAQVSYGAFWKSGYALHDNPDAAAATSAMTAATSTGDQSASFLFPFGIHPTHIAWNVLHYFLELQWPWMIVLFAAGCLITWGAYIEWKKFGRLDPKTYAVPLLAFWTLFSLAAYYGHGLYSDNINGNVTVANSFIRYLLPVGPLVGLAAAFLFAQWKRLAIPLAILLAVFGVWMGYVRDAEGVWTTRGELMRYADARTAAAQTFHPSDVILSERSDKIFFPAFRAVSPLPTPAQVRALSDAHPEIHIGLYVRPLAQAQSDAWRMAGFEPVELGVFGREKLYLLRPIQR